MNYTYIMRKIRELQQDIDLGHTHIALYHLRCIEGEILHEIDQIAQSDVKEVEV